VGYHNHSGEFRLQDEDSPWDAFFANTCMDVVMQLDIGNAFAAGVDPAAILKRYPDRAATIHVKEFCSTNPQAYIGEGEVDWKEIFDLLESLCGTEWYIVEYEAAGMPPLESVGHCIDNLHRMGK
jgi:sugar phosphate isomerase/epimerase